MTIIIPFSGFGHHPAERPSEARQRVSWRVRTLAERYRIPLSQAAVYATEMDLPGDRRRS